jgi:GxxExxY protein
VKPPTHADRRRLDSITERIIGCAYEVANILGHGFLENVYENALAHELSKNGPMVEQQKSIKVLYKNGVVGEYVADLLVEGSVLVELKAVKALNDHHLAQCLNYLKATGLKVCLLINFGTPKIEVQRVVHRF